MFHIIKQIRANRKLYPKLFWQEVITRLFAEMFTISVPFVASKLINLLTQGRWGSDLFSLLAVYLLVTIGENIFTRITRTTHALQNAKIQLLKTKEYIKKFFATDYSLWQSEWTGKIITKIQNGVEAEMAIRTGIIKFLCVACFRLAVILTIYAFHVPAILIVLIIWALILAWVTIWSQKKVKPMYDKLKDINEDLQRQTAKTIMEKVLITLSWKQEQELRMVDHIMKDQPRLTAKTDFWNSVTFEIMDTIFRLFEIGCYLFIGWQIIQGSSSIGELVMLTTYTWYMRWPLSIIGDEMSAMRKNRAKYESLHSFLNTPQTVVNGSTPYTYEYWDIQLRNISFQYESTQVFKDFSLHIAPHKTTALVGHSGSGKSTLIKLLLRMYDPQKGSLFLDGQDIRTLQAQSRYSHIWYLSQEPAIFDGTVRDNLSYALNDDIDLMSTSSEDKMWLALEKAQIAELVRGFEKGLDTELWEKGIKLSGGEKQRLAIARIFLKDPHILILDEPTSALDSISEAKITEVIKEMMKNRTVIVIAHRLQTVMHADAIVVLEKGKIIQQGKHADLIEQEWVYKTLVDLQHGVIQE